jgi:CRISPR-associated protein Cmr3
MTMLVLHPLDTVFFRDGRPYNQDDPGQVEAASVFPPYPPTVVGAVRAALARAMGWTGGAWGDELKNALGDGVNWQEGEAHLGSLRFAGPYALKDGKPLFPAPLCLVKGKSSHGDDVIGQLAPGQEVECDLGGLGKVRLPAVPNRTDTEGWKVLERTWLTADGMERVLNGETPEKSHILKADQIWQAESRVGIQRHTETRTTMRFVSQEEGEPAKGAIYAAAHARPAQDVVLAIEVEGLPDVSLGKNLAPLGGEGRSAWIEQQDGKVDLPKAPALRPDKEGVLRYTVTLVTPVDLGDAWPDSGDHLNGAAALPGRIVSACLGRAIPVGGWDGLANHPLPLRPLIPAGSMWFLEAKTEDAAAAASWHGRAIGRATGWGFGRVLVGRWAPAGEGT